MQGCMRAWCLIIRLKGRRTDWFDLKSCEITNFGCTIMNRRFTERRSVVWFAGF